MTELERAFSEHRAKLSTIEALSKTATDPMQQILAVDLGAFGRRLDSWATAVPLHTVISVHDQHDKQLQEGDDKR